MNRREFLKTAYRVGGLAALYSLGAVRQAQAWGILPAVVGGDKSSPWATWDEASEDTLPVDMDGDGNEDTFICFMENPVAGGDETGRGVVAGADLVMTDSGGENIPGALGTPPYRTFATNRWGVITKTCAEILKGSTWCIVMKFDNFTDSAGTMLRFMDSSSSNNAGVAAISHNNGSVTFYPRGTNIGTTVDAMPNDQTVWVALQANGVDTVTGGWDTSKITKWADVPANQKVVAAAEMGDLSAVTFNATLHLIMDYLGTVSNSAYQVDADLYYFLLSKVALIE